MFNCPASPDSTDPHDMICVRLQLRGIDTIATLRRDIDHLNEKLDVFTVGIEQAKKLLYAEDPLTSEEPND
jgi:hypothetical protein